MLSLLKTRGDSRVIEYFISKQDSSVPMFKKYRPALDLFLEFMGDRPVDQIRQMDIENYFDLLCKLPPRWFDEKRIRKATAIELAAMEWDKCISYKTFKDGYLHPGDKPGLGVEFNEEAALSYPYQQAYLPYNRLVDGTVHDW